MVVRSLFRRMESTAKSFGMSRRRLMAPVFFLIAICLATLLPVSVSFAQTVSFSPQATFNAGSNPISVAIGDLNGDGNTTSLSRIARNTRLDPAGHDDGSFAVTNFRVHGDPGLRHRSGSQWDGWPTWSGEFKRRQISDPVWRRTGQLSADSFTHFPWGTEPASVAIGISTAIIFDLARRTRQQQRPLLLGDGAGGFSSTSTYVVGSNPRSVAIGDLNGDGKPDLVVANIGSDNVSILLGDGNGAFGTVNTLTVGDQPLSVAIGDLNDDGKPDLAVANSNSSSVSILINTGAGNLFDPSLIFTYPRGRTNLRGHRGSQCDGKLDLLANGVAVPPSILLVTAGCLRRQRTPLLRRRLRPRSGAIGNLEAISRPTW